MKQRCTLIFIFFCLISLGYSQDTDDLRFESIQDLIKKTESDPEFHNPRLTSAQQRNLKKSVTDIFDKGVRESAAGYSPEPLEPEDDPNDPSLKPLKGYEPQHLYSSYYSLLIDIFKSGKLKQAHLDYFVQKYKSELINKTDGDQGLRKQAEASGNVKGFWKNKYSEFFDNFINKVKQNPASCAAELENATAAKCCRGLLRLNATDQTGANRCKLADTTCNQNSDCCSGLCNQENPEVAGKCEPKKVCYKVVEEGQACGVNRPVCRVGTCLAQDINVTGLVNCKKRSNSCSSDSQCCSNKCSAGKCVENKLCLDCVKSKRPLERGEKCCPGYIKMDNKCLSPIPPFIPYNGTVKNDRSIWKRIFFGVSSIFISSAFAQETSNVESENSKVVTVDNITDEDRAGLNEAQIELLETKRSECQGDEDCLKKVDRLEVGFVRDGFTGVTKAQAKQIADAKKECTNKHDTWLSCNPGTEGCPEVGKKLNPKHKECMDEVSSMEKQIMAENAEDGNFGQSFKKENLGSNYNIPGVTAKTYSDISQCEFNSFNDSWRDASASERNAEVFLRSFEFVFSHKGTQDFWVQRDGGVVKGNIFSRANKVAQTFRENRRKMMEEMRGIDKKMTCKCIAIYGPSKFSQTKQAYFQQNCAEEVAELQSSLSGQELNNLALEKTGEKGTLEEAKSKIDGTSINSLNSKEKKDKALIEEIDKGASGISHGALLVEFLRLRASAQVSRFSNNADLETELEELSEYIQNIDFDLVYYPKRRGKKIVPPDGAPPQAKAQKKNYAKLNGWTYKAWRGWVLVIVGVAGALLVNPGFLAVSVMGGMLELTTGGPKVKNQSVLIQSMTEGAWREVDNKSAAPKLEDIRYKTKSVSAGTKKKYYYHRFFLGPYYRHVDAENSRYEVCDVMGRASACVRTAYMVDFFESVENGKPRFDATFLLDPTQPLFVQDNVIRTKHMPKHNKSWVEMINEANRLGIAYLKTKSGKSDYLTSALNDGYFFPKAQGSNTEIYEPTKFDESLKNKIKEAARKYALCKGLNDPSAKDNYTFCNVSSLEENEIGFGYLFESQVEAEAFAKYTYDVHYEWSHLTKENYLGYPAAGIDHYFRMVAYNMKLAGSLAASRAVQSSDAADLYSQDLAARINEYKAKSIAGIGKVPKSLKFKPAFFKAFSKINFTGTTDIPKANAALTEAKNSGNLTRAEIDTLNSAVNGAVRRNRAIERKKKFDKALLESDPLTQKIARRNVAALNKRVNAPLEQFDVQKLGGGGGGFKKLNNAINNLNKSIEDFNQTANKQSGSAGDGNIFTLPKGIGSSSYNSSNYSTSEASGNPSVSSSTTISSDTGMSKDEISNIIENLNQEDLKSSSSDTLFTVVSKAYKRNYSRVLRRNTSVTSSVAPNGDEAKELKVDKKEELKKLLEN